MEDALLVGLAAAFFTTSWVMIWGVGVVQAARIMLATITNPKTVIKRFCNIGFLLLREM